MVKKVKLCYIDTDSSIVYIETDDIYKDIAENVKTRFDTSNHKLERPLPKEKNKKVIGLMKNELGENIMTKFVGLRTKTYSYIVDNGSEDKKAKGTKTKRKRKFKNYKNCLEATQLENEIYDLEKTKINVDGLKKIISNS